LKIKTKIAHLQHRDDTSVNIIRFRRFGVKDIDGETSARNAEDGRFVEEIGELFGIQRGT